MTTVYAKGKIGGQQPTIYDHTINNLEAFSAIFGSTVDTKTFTGKNWKKYFNLSDEEYIKFYYNTKYSNLFHDFGKAEKLWQDDIINTTFNPKLIRHELLSALILLEDPFRHYIESLPNSDYGIILSAILGHHLKINENSVFEPKADYNHIQIVDFSDDLCKLIQDNTLCSYVKNQLSLNSWSNKKYSRNVYLS